MIDDKNGDKMTTATPRFEQTWCSSCGSELGPGDHGVSHCDDHAPTAESRERAEMLRQLEQQT